MVNSNKILTVSYGTFSCTLEGFEDSFGTMKAIAEYFRDLAAQDRYFGAEPPQPDAEMLARIAEREIARRVEARLDGTGIVLRARDTGAPAQVAAPATPVPAAAPMTPAPVPAALAAAAVAAARADEAAKREETATATPAEAMPNETVADDESVAAFFAQSDTALDDTALDDTALADTALAEADADTAPVTVDPAARIEDEYEDTQDDDTLEAEVAAPAHARAPETVRIAAESISAKLQRIRAVVARSEAPRPVATEFTEDEHAEKAQPAVTVDETDAEDDSDTVTAERVLSILGAATAARSVSADDDMTAGDTQEPETADEDATLDDVAALAFADDEAVTEHDDEVDEAADADDDLPAFADEDENAGLVDQDEDPAFAGADDRDAALTEDSDTALAEDTQPAPQGRVVKVGRAEFDALMAEAGFAATDETKADKTAFAEDEDDVDFDEVAEDDRNAAEDEADIGSILDADEADDLEEETPEDIFAASATLDRDAASDDFDLDEGEMADADDLALSPEDEDELRRELAEVEADSTERLPAADDADESADDTDEDDILMDADDEEDDEIESLFAEPVEAEDEAEPAPRDRAARVAAPAVDDDLSRLLAEADRNLGGSDSAARRSDFDHLRAAVAASRAETAAGLAMEQKPSENPYRLDLAQVVRPRRPEAPSDTRDRARRPEDQKPAPLKLVAAQRVDARIAPVKPRRVTSEPVFEESASAMDGAMSFAEFAQRTGAVVLPDLLEAAASYLSFVEKRTEFSRPQLMSKVRALDPEEFTREDGLRSFGQLLRDGKIEKIQGGRFTVSDSIGFRPEDLRAAG